MTDERADRLENKIDKIVDQLADMNVILAKQEVNLQVHMKRSDLLEKQMQPIRKHVSMVNGATKLISLAAVVAGAVVAVIQMIKGLK